MPYVVAKTHGMSCLCHFLQKSPIFRGYSVESDLRDEASYGCLELCTDLRRIDRVRCRVAKTHGMPCHCVLQCVAVFAVWCSVL